MTRSFTAPLQAGLPEAELLARLAPFGGERDPLALAKTLVVRLAREQLRAALLALRDGADTRCDQLLDVVGIDYLSYPEWRGPRFAVVYPLKSTVFRHRLALKVLVEENDAVVPSVHDLYRSANWAEREVWDQFGIVFQGHPNLKRLLNHHEFVGHPLRKDYPCQKRQKLSLNDPMHDELIAKLESLGWQVLERPEPSPGIPLGPMAASAGGQR
ncbi:MAG: NADH-quinone oxidoreductase subunit C [Planctomycetes bacterium]|nr:NADH-quinone oxidoreductase subunit C [Planctomycetota bacterium]